MQDSEIIKGIREKNEDAFRYLVDTWRDKVISTCFGFLRNMEDAEDIAQEVFVEVYCSIASFRGDCNLPTWIYRIAVNKSLNFLKRRKKSDFLQNMGLMRNLSIGRDHHEPVSEQTDSESAELLVLVQKGINTLPENQRIAFTLCKYEELSYHEIAGIMNLSLSSVESLIHRAKCGLQKKLVLYLKK